MAADAHFQATAGFAVPVAKSAATDAVVAVPSLYGVNVTFFPLTLVLMFRAVMVITPAVLVETFSTYCETGAADVPPSPHENPSAAVGAALSPD